MASHTQLRATSGRQRTWPFAGLVALLLACVAAGVLSQTGTDPYTLWDGDVRSPAAFADWLLAATTEPNFYTSALAGIGLLAGGCLAHWLSSTERRGHGFVQACGSGLWPAAVASALLGLLLSNLVWGWTLAESGEWQPTFVPFVSVSPTIVLLFGPSLRNVLIGAVLGGVLTTPFSLVGTNLLCEPLGLPLVVGVTAGMAVGALASFGICRLLPFMQPLRSTADDHVPRRRPSWLGRRILADFSEAQFFGSEWASAGMILGAVVAYALSPDLPVYGTGLLPSVLLAQAVTAITGIALWQGRWSAAGFYPTFVPIVSVAPAAVLAHDGWLPGILTAAVLGAAIGPPLAAAIARRLPHDFHPFIGNVASMAISTALIVPALDLLPT